MNILRILIVISVAAPLALPLAAATRRMFVTSVTGTGDLSSWADAGGLPNAAGYRAWLSDSIDDAYCRLHNLTGKKASNCGEAVLPAAAGPRWRPAGAPVGAGLAPPGLPQERD